MKTVLSVRDFAILLSIASNEIDKLQGDGKYQFYKETDEEYKKRREKKMIELQSNTYYQDLLRIREKLGELNIEIETPIVEVE